MFTFFRRMRTPWQAKAAGATRKSLGFYHMVERMRHVHYTFLLIYKLFALKKLCQILVVPLVAPIEGRNQKII